MEPDAKINHGEKHVAFHDAVPKSGPEVFILRMKAEKALTFTAWGDKIKGIEIHWAGDRSVPHFEPVEECEACLKCLPKKWKGYLHCYCSEMKQEVFVEMTPKVASSFLDQVPNPNHLRGCVFQLKRGKSANSRMDIRILNPVDAAVGLPPAKDPRKSILKLYGFSQRDIDRWLPLNEGQEPENDFH